MATSLRDLFRSHRERLFTGRSGNGKPSKYAIAPRLDFVCCRKTKHAVPPNSVTTISRSLPIGSVWRKLRPPTLMANSVIPEGHPLLMELLGCHTRTIVLNNQGVIVLFLRHCNLNFCSTCVPCISNQLCERNFRRLRDGSESANEEVFLEEAALQWLNLGNSMFAGLHTCLVHENTITIPQGCKGCHIDEHGLQRRARVQDVRLAGEPHPGRCGCLRTGCSMRALRSEIGNTTCRTRLAPGA